MCGVVAHPMVARIAANAAIHHRATIAKPVRKRHLLRSEFSQFKRTSSTSHPLVSSNSPIVSSASSNPNGQLTGSCGAVSRKVSQVMAKQPPIARRSRPNVLACSAVHVVG